MAGAATIRVLAPGDDPAVARLLEATRVADGHGAFDALPVGATQLAAWDANGDATGWAYVAPGGGAWELGLALHPAHRGPDDPDGPALGRQSAELVAGAGGGELRWWVTQPRPDQYRAAEAAGLAPGRTLYQMRRPLPVPRNLTRDAGPLSIRAFVPGSDEEAWLAVNNRAFAGHPEQGDWDRATLEAREREPWFDPAGFLMAEIDGALAGFCWTKVHGTKVHGTKVHTADNPPIGEIYVIAADPDSAGRGLGRGLVLAGLDHLARRGLTLSMLYTDTDNVAAVKLYVDLGFVVQHRIQLFAGAIAPA
ncbi:MAG: mycothiol synthase [Acidimicrobiales bacterium]